jgi:hypothetical protein
MLVHQGAAERFGRDEPEDGLDLSGKLGARHCFSQRSGRASSFSWAPFATLADESGAPSENLREMAVSLTGEIEVMKTISIAITGAIAALVLLGTTHQTIAQTAAPPAVTVTSLLKEGYELVSTIRTTAGNPGLFLRKGQSIYLCFVAETPRSKSVATQYCKPVE